jgi:hypothetical protein
MKLLLRYTPILPALLFFGCAMNLAGGGSEGEARVTGKITTETGTPSPGAIVKLIPSTFNPVTGLALPDSFIDTTGKDGWYSFVTSIITVYNVEASDAAGNKWALITGISPAINRVTSVSDGILQSPGFCRIVLPYNSDSSAGYVFVPGTMLSAQVKNDSAVLDDVPAGLIPAVMYGSLADSSKLRTIRTGVTISPNDTTVLADYATWKFSGKITLNTTASGANVFGDVANFPVLIRLTSNNFYFSQSMSNGEDIRFAKSDGSPLPYEIEQWDAAAQAAEIWVKVDTVHGNNSSQNIVMYWGNPNAASASNSKAVFDTANGFQGVWHLAQAGNTTAFDATANHYDGTPTGMSAASTVTGAIGQAQKFDGVSSFITLKNTAGSKLNFPEQGIYTISAWVKTDTLDTNYHVIIAKGYFDYSLQLIYNDNWEFFDYIDAQEFQATRAVAISHEWTHLVAVRSGIEEHFYVNGELADSVLFITPNGSNRYTGYDVTIGKASDELSRFFNGTIDEVRIHNTTCSPDWIKLNYMNQKEIDALAVFK